MRSIYLAVLLAVSSAACSSAGPSNDAAALEGRTFVATELVGPGATRDTEVTMSFSEGQLTWSTGCHDFVGSFHVADAHLVYERSENNWVTADACIGPGQSMRVESWVGELVADNPLVSLRGRQLELTRGGDSILLRSVRG